jgi:hypothetical protein
VDLWYSYEALPANYGLGHNMLAGAFAGIAVWVDFCVKSLGRDADAVMTGTYGDVPGRSDEGTNVRIAFAAD